MEAHILKGNNDKNFISTDENLVICVSLKEGLFKSDFYWDILLKVLKVHPFIVFKNLMSFKEGKRNFIEYAFKSFDFNEIQSIFNQNLISYLSDEYKSGRTIYLLDDYSDEIARIVLHHYDFLNDVVTFTSQFEGSGITTERMNTLNETFGENNFVYFARKTSYVRERTSNVLSLQDERNSKQDLHSNDNVKDFLYEIPFSMRIFFKAARVHQWAKNLLVFLPLLVNYTFDMKLFLNMVTAFFSLSFCSSGTYLINDLVDLDDDRNHYSKCARPFAAGKLSLKFGFIFAPILYVLGLSMAFVISKDLAFMLLVYCGATSLYSFYFKRFILIDVSVLAFLYIWRIQAGSEASGLMVPQLLLMSCSFLFFSLALAKRSTELCLIKKTNKGAPQGRGYSLGDLNLVNITGVTSGFIAALFLGLYYFNAYSLGFYGHLEPGFFISGLFLLWISRIWFVTGRGELSEDIVIYIVKDKFSYGVFMSIFILLALAK